MMSVPLYLTVNIIFFFLEIGIFEQVIVSKAIFASKIGLDIYRSTLPFAEGLNGAGILSSLGLTITATYLYYNWSKIGNKFYYYVFILGSIAGLLVTDSRGGVLYFFASFFISLFVLNKKHTLFWTSIIYVFTISLGFFTIVVLQDKLVEFYRDGSTLFSGREILWYLSLQEIFSTNLSTLLIGNGYKGHELLNIFNDYFIFLNKEEHFTTAHNFIFQTIIDNGLIALFILVYCIASFITILSRTKMVAQNHNVLIAILIFFLVSGATEASINFYHKILFNIFILLSCYCISYKFKKSNKELII